MPTISRFFGIVITMWYREHAPPHFHAGYAGAEAVVGIDPARVLEGRLPARQLALVLRWAALHRAELATSPAGVPPPEHPASRVG
jgi:hypothetical protein